MTNVRTEGEVVVTLKPCPFCGGDDIIESFIQAGDFVAWSVECQTCGAERADDESALAARDAWNTRLSTAGKLPEREAELRRVLAIGERFCNACFSAWSCGEPYHRVKTMLDRADEFRAALDSLSLMEGSAKP